MKRFEDICKLSQEELKAYMHKYLSSKKYDVINEDGFLYAKGDVPVLLLAHMDTVHKSKPTLIYKDAKGKISSPQGIGGDDRCGIFIIMNLVRELHCSVLLCEDEESGGIGARKFIKTDYMKDLGVNYMVEFDRKGSEDAVFYDCDSKDFTNFITETTGFKKAYGSFSDISVVAPAAKIAAVNLSCGYYNAHTLNEYVVVSEMENTIEVAKKLITTESKQYEYIKKTYSYGGYGGWGGYYDNYYSDDFWGDYYNGAGYSYGSKKKKTSNEQLTFAQSDSLGKQVKKDIKVQLEVYYHDEYGQEAVAFAEGNTKAEAWLEFFINNPSISFDMVYDYIFV